jgi:hypothetical protein
MTDRGLAALAAAIHATHHHVTIANGQPSPDFDGEFAAAILGERGVFLPEEDCGHVGFLKATVLHDEIRDREATIATLRAAQAHLGHGALVFGGHAESCPAIQYPAGQRPECECGWDEVRDLARTALAAAKEATDD